MSAFAKSWETLKALPEQQQYTNLPGLGGGFEQETPQHRVGTVHPAIRQMLQRLQNYQDDGYTEDPAGSAWDRPKPMPPSLRTTGTSDENPPTRGMIEAHRGRSGRPGLDHELYSGEYGQSPQFVTSMPSYRGVPDYEGRIAIGGETVQGRLESQVPYASGDQTPKGSPQAMIDELYRKDPDAAAALFNKAWDFLKNNPSPFGASPSSDYNIDMGGGGAASGYSPYTMDTGANVRDSAIPEGTEDPHPLGPKTATEKYKQSNSQKPWYNLEDEYRYVTGGF